MISPVKIWRNQKKVRILLGLTGKIISYTKVFAPPAGFEAQAPFVVVVVRLDNGIKYMAQLVDWNEENLRTDQKVKAVLRRTRDPGGEGVIPYGVKFKPL